MVRDTGTVSRHGLLAQTADGHDAAAQGDFTGHCDLVAHRCTGQRRDDSRCHGDTGRRAVLGTGSLGEMDMDVGVLIEIGVDAQHLGTRTDEGDRSLCALLHDLAEIAGDLDLARTGYGSDLDLQHLTANARPRQTVDDADLVLLGHVILLELGRAQEGFQVSRMDGDALCRAVCDLLSRLAAQLGNDLLRPANACLTGITRNDSRQGFRARSAGYP